MGLMDYDARFYSQSLGRFIQPDTLIPSVAIPQTWNRYSYTQNNPIKFTDPSGHWIETAFDILSIGMDIADIAQNGLNLANGAALVLDVASAVIPGVPAFGGLILKASKAANAVDNAMDAAKIVNKADNIADTAKALKNGAEELGTCLVNSFKADTDVETSEGPKDISAIQIGDYVLAWDESSGTLGYYEVTNAFHHTDAVVTEVIVGGEWIETTPEHPFYVEGEGWVYAEDLQIGDEVRQADGTTGMVWLKWNVYKTQEMYNLTVDTAHTFFVGEGQWLVHNACDDLLAVRHYTDEATKKLINESGHLRPDTYVTLPSELPSSSGHLQIEELLEIAPNKGTNYVDVTVPKSNLKVPLNGSTTSGGALQYQLINQVPLKHPSWRRPPGRPTIME